MRPSMSHTCDKPMVEWKRQITELVDLGICQKNEKIRNILNYSIESASVSNTKHIFPRETVHIYYSENLFQIQNESPPEKKSGPLQTYSVDYFWEPFFHLSSIFFSSAVTFAET